MAEGRLTTDADRLLRELRVEFRAMAEQRLDEMDALLARLAAGPADDALRSLRRNAHGLAGSGGSVGLPEVTRLARVLEGECRVRIESGQAPLEGELASWTAVLGGLRAALTGD